MIGRPRSMSGTVVPAILFALLLAGSVQAQGPGQSDRARALREGTHVFRRILFDYKLRPLTSTKALTEAPDRTILVVLGNLDILSELPEPLETFVRQGGAALVASDRAMGDRAARRALIDAAGVSINRESLTCPNPRLCYRELDYCPFVQPTQAGSALFQSPRGGPWTLNAATNVPSRLRLLQRIRGLDLLAVLPSGCQIQTSRGPVVEMGVSPFAVGGTLGAGQLLVLADHSLFINEMMLPTDTNNVEFTYNVVTWLRGENNRRDRVLFLEDGRVESRFDIPMRSPNIPIEDMLRMLFEKRNELLVGAENDLTRMESQDRFNKGLLGWLTRLGLPPQRLWRLFVVVGSLVLGLYLIYRLGMRDRFRHETTIPVLSSAVGRNLPVSSLTEQRQHALLASGNLSEPASRLVRAWFTRLGLAVPTDGTSAPPRFHVRGGWWQAHRQRLRLLWLWRLATGRLSERISPPRMWGLERELVDLGRQWLNGQWSVDGTVTPRGSA